MRHIPGFIVGVIVTGLLMNRGVNLPDRLTSQTSPPLELPALAEKDFRYFR